MTPDLSTPEGRAAARKQIGQLQLLQEAMIRGCSIETILIDALDAAHATIERLTAPVTEEEADALQDHVMRGFEMGQVWSLDCYDAVTAFIARRKDPTP